MIIFINDNNSHIKSSGSGDVTRYDTIFAGQSCGLHDAFPQRPAPDARRCEGGEAEDGGGAS
jgi:hypothetical protein